MRFLGWQWNFARASPARKLALIAWICLLGALAYGKWGARDRAHYAAWRAVRNCDAFSATADRAVFEGNSVKAATLIAKGGYRSGSIGAIWTSFDATIDAIDASGHQLELFKSYTAPGSIKAPVPVPLGGWKILDFSPAPVYPMGSPPGATKRTDLSPIFLHELKSGSIARLVEIRLRLVSSSYSNQLTFEALIRPRGGVTSAPPDLSASSLDWKAIGPVRFMDFSALRIFAGQSDPADPSRCTVKYQMADRKGTITFQIRPDGHLTSEISGPMAEAPTEDRLFH